MLTLASWSRESFCAFRALITASASAREGFATIWGTISSSLSTREKKSYQVNALFARSSHVLTVTMLARLFLSPYVLRCEYRRVDRETPRSHVAYHSASASSRHKLTEFFERRGRGKRKAVRRNILSALFPLPCWTVHLTELDKREDILRINISLNDSLAHRLQTIKADHNDESQQAFFFCYVLYRLLLSYRYLFAAMKSSMISAPSVRSTSLV